MKGMYALKSSSFFRHRFTFFVAVYAVLWVVANNGLESQYAFFFDFFSNEPSIFVAVSFYADKDSLRNFSPFKSDYPSIFRWWLVDFPFIIHNSD